MSKRYPGGIIRKTPQTPSQTSAQGIWDMASVTQAVKENTWPIAGVPDPISKSLRFRASASAYLDRTFASAGNRRTYTLSLWVKRGSLDGSANQFFFGSGVSTTAGGFYFTPTNQLEINPRVNNTNTYITTTQVFRDPSAWYHIVVALDTTQATDSNRLKLYVNGVQVTAFSAAIYPALNGDSTLNNNIAHWIGRYPEPGFPSPFDGYLAEYYFIDGQALTPSSFGNTNDQTGVWQPIVYTGTYGTNGFYLPFSNTASTSTLGNDFSGNSNNWTTNNISLTTGTSIQSFTSTGTTLWTAPTGVTSVNYLVVAGGGSGGGYVGGGGGAGGLLTGTLSVVPGIAYTVTVGAGGTAVTGTARGNSGSNSVFNTVTATGGGGGGSRNGTTAGISGGSGGGGAFNAGAGGAGTSGQGFAGAANNGANGSASGGGGASAVGGTNATNGGTGGAGLASSISGFSVTYAGGGGGGTDAGSGGAGGAGGGGAGASTSGNGTDGTPNTGGGGGGAGSAGGAAISGAGGSGIVILSWTSGATTTYDSMNDVPTQWIPYNTTGDTGALWRGNYCTWNPLDKNSGITTSNGNLDTAATVAYNRLCRSTFGMSSGKWYCEIVLTSGTVGGIVGLVTAAASLSVSPGDGAGGWGYVHDGRKVISGTYTSYGASYGLNDVVGLAFDADNGTFTCYKNGATQGTLVSGLTSGTYFFGTDSYTAQTINFGQRPFSYTPPSGFKTLNTTNLPTPTIGATASTTANKYFDATLYTGNNSTLTVTNAGGFKPDLLWFKRRSGVGGHGLYNSVTTLGASLAANGTGVEIIPSPNDSLTAINSNGFTLGANNNSGAQDINYSSGSTFVAWQWQAGQGTTSSNTDGTITSTVSANTTAGFSIVTYTGDGNSGATVGHGLGVAPSMVILKQRDGASSWQVKHVSLNANQNLVLNSTAAVDTAPGSGYISAISSTTLTLLNGGSAITNVNANNGTYVAYCFAQVAGYSAFGSYTGNGSTDGPFIFTGFRPRFVMIKASSISSEHWYIVDATRSPYNAAILYLSPDDSDAETSPGAAQFFDFLSNGFKLRVSGSYSNSSGATYIYMAFAESPFKYSLAR